jgi:hypothetical protein
MKATLDLRPVFPAFRDSMESAYRAAMADGRLVYTADKKLWPCALISDADRAVMEMGAKRVRKLEVMK